MNTWDPDYLPEAASHLLGADEARRSLAAIEAWRQLGFWAALFTHPWREREEGER